MVKLKSLIIATFLLVSCAFATTSFTQKRIYNTKKITSNPPTIDGLGNDPVWSLVEWQADFIERSPSEGDKPSQETSFKVLYDDENLYALIKADDTEPNLIDQRIARRDNVSMDNVRIILDSYFDHRTAFVFTISVSGVKFDQIISGDAQNFDPGWDPVWFAETSIIENGWIAEIRIPLTQLRFEKENNVWGMQVARWISRENEFSLWQFVSQNDNGWVSFFGELHGIENLNPKLPFELSPYSVASTHRFEADENNPFADGGKNRLSGGLDGKIGLANDFMLNFTINPDFGQVESDPSEVNLSTFETFLEEKRPFFVEGRDILEYKTNDPGAFNLDKIFYSRRIGSKPHHEPDTASDEYIDMPDYNTILGAIKLTGKTNSGLSIGILESITKEETAEIDSLGKRKSVPVEPLTNYFIGRIQKDFNGGNTVLGGIITTTNRNIKDSNLNFLHKSAYTAGINFKHFWDEKTYYVSLNGLFSTVTGSKEAVLETQTASARYFQRPDADYVSVDSNLTSLTGYGGSIELGKERGHFRYSANFAWRSPGLELNDVGYLRIADEIKTYLTLRYVIWEPFSIFNNLTIEQFNWLNNNFGWEIKSMGHYLGCNALFSNNWSLTFGIGEEYSHLSPYELRGGPSLVLPSSFHPSFYMSTDQSKNIFFELGLFQNLWGHNHSKSSGVNFGITYRPTNAIELSVHPSVYFNKSNLMYVDTKEFQNENRYIFASLDQKTLDITIRLNYYITPDFSIQFYSQPFVSRGDYSQFKKITNPRAEKYNDRYYLFNEYEITEVLSTEEYAIDENSDGITDYKFDNPDFNSLQFNSNLVVRWEFFPGSTLFLVWSQGRTKSTTRENYALTEGIRNIFDIHPDDIFLIKFNYLFSL